MSLKRAEDRKRESEVERLRAKMRANWGPSGERKKIPVPYSPKMLSPQHEPRQYRSQQSSPKHFEVGQPSRAKGVSSLYSGGKKDRSLILNSIENGETTETKAFTNDSFMVTNEYLL